MVVFENTRKIKKKNGQKIELSEGDNFLCKTLC